jgi:ligand-binding SRPBCC domain-containing protein
MGHSFQSDQLVLHPIELVFAFFANPFNLALLMPAWQNARIQDASLVPPPVQPGVDRSRDLPEAVAAGAGSRLTLSFRPVPLSPVRLSWQAEIAEFAWNHHFTDRQIRGPFASWSHRHLFRPIDREGMHSTVITDVIEYEMPLGALGELAHRLLVRRQIHRAFAYREAELPRVLASLASQTQDQNQTALGCPTSRF